MLTTVRNTVVIEPDISIAELEEALGYLSERLKIDKYGARMDWRKKDLLQSSIDDLLDERLLLSKSQEKG